jgi:hypothetical protein
MNQFAKAFAFRAQGMTETYHHSQQSLTVQDKENTTITIGEDPACAVYYLPTYQSSGSPWAWPLS